MAAKKKKGHLGTAVIVIVAAVGVLVAYLWHKNKQAAASQSGASSSGLASVAYPSQAGMVESPNSFGSAPIIQNFTSATASSTAVSPVTVVHAFSKPRPPRMHRPTSPWRTPSGTGQSQPTGQSTGKSTGTGTSSKQASYYPNYYNPTTGQVYESAEPFSRNGGFNPPGAGWVSGIPSGVNVPGTLTPGQIINTKPAAKPTGKATKK